MLTCVHGHFVKQILYSSIKDGIQQPGQCSSLKVHVNPKSDKTVTDKCVIIYVPQ